MIITSNAKDIGEDVEFSAFEAIICRFVIFKQNLLTEMNSISNLTLSGFYYVMDCWKKGSNVRTSGRLYNVLNSRTDIIKHDLLPILSVLAIKEVLKLP